MLFLTLLGGVNAAWGQEVTYDFTGSDWSVTDGVLTNGTVSITGEGGANFKMNSGYFMFGQSGAYITLPAYDFDVEKIEVVGRSGASGSCKQNIFVGDEAVSTETTGVTGSNSYDIDANYQAAGTRYTIKVTSRHNSQITAIKIYKAGGTVVETVATPTFSPGGGIFTESQDVEISCTTDDATIYYTTDGSTPTDESDEYDGAITVSETTTIKAIAVKEGMNNSAVASATYTIKVADPDWIDFTVQGYTNAEDVTTVTGANGSVTFAKGDGTNAPKWYDSGSAVRIYTNNTVTITAEEDKKIESVEFSITSGSMNVNNFNVNGTYSNNIFILTPPANSIVYTTSSNFRLDKIKINLSSDTREEAGLSYSAEEYTATIDGQNEFPTLSNPNELAVSYESTNEDVATIDESGIVTLVAAGTTTISATSEETDTYLAGTASYTLTVTDPNAPGTENNPYTVAQANEAIANNTGLTNVYVKGIVSQIDEVSTEYGNATYWISDDGTTSGQLESYRGKYLDNANFTSEDQIQVGDEVVIYGTLQDYQGTNEFKQGNYLVSLERPNQPKYYVVGYHNNWDNGSAVTEDLELKRTADGTLKVSVELGGEGQTGDFKIIKVEDGLTTAWYGAEADGSFWVTADNYTDIPLVDYDGAPNLHLNTYGTYDFTLNISGNQPTLTVDGDWPRKNYYVIGQGVGSLEEMLEMTYNEDNGVYECEITFRETDAPGYWFAISDIASASSWDDLNANHRYSVQSGDYTLTKDNSSNVQLIKTNGTMMVYNAGTYKLTLTEDLKLTVTGWPIILDGNAFVKVTSTDDLTDGYYLIVYEGDEDHKSVAFNGGLETGLDGNENSVVVTIAEKLIAANNTTNAAVVTIKAEDNGYSIQTNSGIYIGTNSNSNELKTSQLTPFIHTVAFDEGNVLLTGSAGAVLRYNSASNQLRFRYYKSTSYSAQQPIALYKLTTVDEIPVTIGSTGYGTLYYSDLALAIPEGVTATYVSSVENGKIEFTNVAERVSTNVIPAGTPVVLKATQGEYKFLVVDESETESPDNNMLCGTDVATTTTAPANAANYDCKFYMLSKKKGGDDSTVGFYYGTGCPNGEAFTNGAHKAYLVVPQMDGSTGAKSFYLFSDAVTDGIGAVENSIFNLDDAKIYNLNGQRVSTPQRGIYIINGKKVLVK